MENITFKFIHLKENKIGGFRVLYVVKNAKYGFNSEVYADYTDKPAEGDLVIPVKDFVNGSVRIVESNGFMKLKGF